MMGRMYAPRPKCRATDYIDFLIASPKAFCCTEAAAVQPESPDPPAHDAFTRLLHRLEPDPATMPAQSFSQRHRETVNPFCNSLQSGRPVIDGIHPRHDCQQHLRRADIARRLLPTDMLFSGL